VGVTTIFEEIRPTMSTLSRRLALASLPFVLIVAACSSGGGATTAPSSAPSVAASEAPSEAPSTAASEAPSAAAAGATIALTDNALGSIIVDADGKTLYGFTPDEGGTPTCYDDCATAWPPLLADSAAAATAGEGLDASKLTTVERTDGGLQVVYGGWPLYYFASDTAAGDTNGQAVGTKWYVVGADGALIGQ
jgi:predicted lipoprotein with Yx(FWY)xxD motif